jgi:hypothetical protein
MSYDPAREPRGQVMRMPMKVAVGSLHWIIILLVAITNAKYPRLLCGVLRHSQLPPHLRRAPPASILLQRPNHLYFAILPLRHAPSSKCDIHIHLCADFGEQVTAS